MISVVLAGIGGMGWVYLQELLKGHAAGEYVLAGTVDPCPERSPGWTSLKDLGLPVFSSLEEFFMVRTADLAVISSPIPFHAPQTVLALRNGSDVLLEKPAAAAIQDVLTMIEAEKRAGGRRVAVGYQWSFSEAIQDLKTEILDGRFGAPLRLRCLYLWPRDFAYYRRNDWAGRVRSASGAWILDSPANNAMAHDLHNMLYLLGPDRETSTRPARVRAELGRAYPIESFDTSAVRIETADGVEILFLASHASASDPGPLADYEFERGTVYIRGRGTPVKAVFKDGSERIYGSPDAEPMRKLRLSLEGIRSGGRPLCGLEAASSQTLVIDGMHDSCPDIFALPSDQIEAADGGERLVVRGLDEALARGYESRALPSEIGLSWGRPGEAIDLTGYKDFPSR